MGRHCRNEPLGEFIQKVIIGVIYSRLVTEVARNKQMTGEHGALDPDES